MHVLFTVTPATFCASRRDFVMPHEFLACLDSTTQLFFLIVCGFAAVHSRAPFQGLGSRRRTVGLARTIFRRTRALFGDGDGPRRSRGSGERKIRRVSLTVRGVHVSGLLWSEGAKAGCFNCGSEWAAPIQACREPGPPRRRGAAEVWDWYSPVAGSVYPMEVLPTLLAKVFVRRAFLGHDADARAVLPDLADVALDVEPRNIVRYIEA